MGKSLFIAEKPSVARQFADVFSDNMRKYEGYLEGDKTVVTWCVGHLVTMSYPEVYDEKYKKWRLSTLPFLPETFLYEVIPTAAKQFRIVSGLLNREDVTRIYVCTDSGREGEYIYRLVRQMAGVKGKEERRVWIDSQTEEEIRRGIREAKDLSAYDHLSDSAYLRAKEDYLMGINFSRLLSLRYGDPMAAFLQRKFCVISVGRVMTCVLGMVVRREREIRDFVKTPFYRVTADADLTGGTLTLEWKAVKGSAFFESPLLYKENGFKEEESARTLIAGLLTDAGEALSLYGAGKALPEGEPESLTALKTASAMLTFDEKKNHPAGELTGVITKLERKKEKKNPPLLYNLAEAQNDCSKLFKISPDETLKIIQELYEKKLVTYPRTDARVLSTAVAKEIDRNLKGVAQIPGVKAAAEHILEKGLYKNLEKTRYVNDKQITDHYAIIPTGQGLRNLNSCGALATKVYEIIVRRFLAIFLPPAEYEKLLLTVKVREESFFATGKYLKSEGYLAVMQYSFRKKKKPEAAETEEPEDKGTEEEGGKKEEDEGGSVTDPEAFAKMMSSFKKGDEIPLNSFGIREGETSPPKRYNSGSLILAMENAGKLIEDEELREQIKSSGIGTSATRAEILNKLVRISYLNLEKKTQIITPTLEGEIIFDIVNASIGSLLNPELTASWEKGLTMVAEGEITPEEYMVKLEDYIRKRTARVLSVNNAGGLRSLFERDAAFYKDEKKKSSRKRRTK